MDWREDFDCSLLDDEALDFLIKYELEGPARRITERVKTHGLDGLSEKQLHVFKTYVVEPWLMRKCACGNHDVEGHELIGLWEDEEGYCGRCGYRMGKDDEREEL